MFRNYLLIAWRNLKKNRVFSFVNIVGLAVGMAACLLILQYVRFELSFDRFHANAADLYRVTNDRYQNGKLIQHGTITYSAVGKALNDEYPEVINHARVHPRSEVIITNGSEKLSERSVLMVDNSFLRMFSFPLLAGNPKNALLAPRTVVITESLARKLFKYTGDDHARWLGRTLQFFNDKEPYRVTGICRDVPENSHLRFNLLISFRTLINDWQAADHSFTVSNMWHYVQLRPGTDYRQVPIDYHHDWNKLRNIILNEKAVQLLGFPSARQALGKQVLIYDRAWDVVGVVADYHQKSLHNPIEPLIMYPAYGNASPISVKVQTQHLAGTVEAIRRKYEAFFPGNLFEYTFLNEQFARQYKDDHLFGNVFGLFSGFAIFVACLGLFGLSLYTITQRTKEIGVRKVLGASETSLLLLLSKDFLRLVLLSNLVAWPLAWWSMELWLQGFTFRITLSPWLLLLPTLIVFVVALITVGLQTLRAARANPVHSLRSE